MIFRLFLITTLFTGIISNLHFKTTLGEKHIILYSLLNVVYRQGNLERLFFFLFVFLQMSGEEQFMNTTE